MWAKELQWISLWFLRSIPSVLKLTTLQMVSAPSTSSPGIPTSRPLTEIVWSSISQYRLRWLLRNQKLFSIVRARMVSLKLLAHLTKISPIDLLSRSIRLHKRLVFTRFKSRILLIQQVWNNQTCSVRFIKPPPMEIKSQSLRTRLKWRAFSFKTNMPLSSKDLVPTKSLNLLMSMT